MPLEVGTGWVLSRFRRHDNAKGLDLFLSFALWTRYASKERKVALSWASRGTTAALALNQRRRLSCLVFRQPIFKPWPLSGRRRQRRFTTTTVSTARVLFRDRLVQIHAPRHVYATTVTPRGSACSVDECEIADALIERGWP